MEELLRDLRDAQTLCKNLQIGAKSVADRAALNFIFAALTRAVRAIANYERANDA